MRTLVVGKDDVSGIILEGLLRPIRKAKPFFDTLAMKFDQDAQMQFRNEGAAGGPRNIPGELAWRPFSPKTLKSTWPNGAWRKRPGTDGATGRRYSPASKMLQASGGFRRSFYVSTTTDDRTVYRTNHRLAGVIGNRPRREVLFVTETDNTTIGRRFTAYVKAGIKF